MLQRKAYNFLYKYFFVVFNIGWFQIFFRKRSIISKNHKGILIGHILNDPHELKKIISVLKTGKFYPIGFIDEVGNIITPYKLQLKQPLKLSTREKRVKFVIELVVLPDSRVALRKIHNKRITFFRELYAMALLRKKGLFIPEIYDYDIKSRVITMEYINGTNLKNLLSDKGANDQLQGLFNTPSYKNSVSLKRYFARTKIEKQFLNQALTDDQLNKINQDIQTLLNNKVIYQDIKYGNFMVCDNKVYWIDFEHCKKHNFITRSFFNSLYDPYNKKIKKHFDLNTSLN